MHLKPQFDHKNRRLLAATGPVWAGGGGAPGRTVLCADTKAAMLVRLRAIAIRRKGEAGRIDRRSEAAIPEIDTPGARERTELQV